MPIIGTNIIKMNVERKSTARNVKVKNNLNIKDIQGMNVNIGDTTQFGLRFIFEYEVIYEPDIATMQFEGEVLYMSTKEVCEVILENFKAKKPISPEVMKQVMNTALAKSSIKSLELSQDMQLPPPVKLPRVNIKADIKDEN